MTVSRYAEKFTTTDGTSIVFTFPQNLYEYDSGSQGLWLPTSPLTGGHYEYFQLGSGLAPKRNVVETVRFLVQGTAAEIENKIEEARQKCYRIGRGKLYTKDSTGARRWCYAAISSMPEFRIDNRFTVPMVIPFLRMSDWYGAAYSSEFPMNEASESFNVVQNGNAKVYNAVFTLDGTFVDPVITNTTNGYRLQSSRDGSSTSHRLRFDAGGNRVEWSTDDGASYAGDYANFSRQAGQVQLMVLEPGTNAFTATFGAVPTATLTVAFDHAYHA